MSIPRLLNSSAIRRSFYRVSLQPRSSPFARGRHADAPVSQRLAVTRSATINMQQKRSTWSDAMVGAGSALTPPAVFVGLVAALWFYKCCMMVLFQNKIIYMPSVPPFSRSEKLSDYAKACFPVIWREDTITSSDNKKLALCVGDNSASGSSHPGKSHVIILYFQGYDVSEKCLHWKIC